MVPELRQDQGLSISLANAAGTNAWIPISVSVALPDRRHRITFRSEQRLEEVMCGELAQLLNPILDGFGGSDAVYSNPDAELRLPGLLMRQLRVIYSIKGRDQAHAQVRFNSVVGNPHRTMINDDGYGYPVEEMTSQVYRDALNWVLLPALNIAALRTEQIRTEDNARSLTDNLEHLRASRDQLMFQVELVKRELGRLEQRVYPKTAEVTSITGGPVYGQLGTDQMKYAAEPAQEDFATMRVLRDMG